MVYCVAIPLPSSGSPSPRLPGPGHSHGEPPVCLPSRLTRVLLRVLLCPLASDLWASSAQGHLSRWHWLWAQLRPGTEPTLGLRPQGEPLPRCACEGDLQADVKVTGTLTKVVAEQAPRGLGCTAAAILVSQGAEAWTMGGCTRHPSPTRARCSVTSVPSWAPAAASSPGFLLLFVLKTAGGGWMAPSRAVRPESPLSIPGASWGSPAAHPLGRTLPFLPCPGLSGLLGSLL